MPSSIEPSKPSFIHYTYVQWFDSACLTLKGNGRTRFSEPAPEKRFSRQSYFRYSNGVCKAAAENPLDQGLRNAAVGDGGRRTKKLVADAFAVDLHRVVMSRRAATCTCDLTS
jgi:hypothetical protein